MYLAHFGFKEAPFAITPDPRYLYMSERHREALGHLLYGLGEPGGFVQLTGEVGTGKTTVCRCLLEQLPSKCDVALVLNPRLTSLELLETVCDELRIPYPSGTASVKPLVDALYRHLLDAHGRGRRTVLIIDEAQDLAADVLEQVRLLTNLETATEKLLQIILIGQPELVELSSDHKLRQLSQRITARYHLTPLSRNETRAFVRHRVEVAGGDPDVFARGAVRHVHRLSGGVPRIINVICDRALLGAYAQNQARVDARTVRRAAAEVLGRPARRERARAVGRITAAAGLVTTCVGAIVLLTPGVLNQLAGGLKQQDRSAAVESAAIELRDRDAPPPKTVSLSPRGAMSSTELSVASEAAARVPTTAVSEGPRRLTLGEALTHPTIRADKRSAFASLYARWRLDYEDGKGDLACDPERVRGLECVYRTGTWKRLRRLNVPAVLELVTPDGERRYGTVVAAGKDDAMLELGGRRFTFPVTEIEPFWDGAFILLWRPPAPGALTITPGAGGKPVEWLRQRLDQIDGQGGGPGSRDVYDERLRARVAAFQRRHGLITDGIVGVETLTRLSAALREPGIPWLSASAP